MGAYRLVPISVKLKPMTTLSAYESLPSPTEVPEGSGIECPECQSELTWDSPSLVMKEPPMRRLNCACGFSKVVVYKG